MGQGPEHIKQVIYAKREQQQAKQYNIPISFIILTIITHSDMISKPQSSIKITNEFCI